MQNIWCERVILPAKEVLAYRLRNTALEMMLAAPRVVCYPAPPYSTPKFQGDLTPVIAACGRLRQENCKAKAILGCTGTTSLTWGPK